MVKPDDGRVGLFLAHQPQALARRSSEGKRFAVYFEGNKKHQKTREKLKPYTTQASSFTS